MNEKFDRRDGDSLNREAWLGPTSGKSRLLLKVCREASSCLVWSYLIHQALVY